MKTKLLRKIEKHLLEEPRRYDQNTYMERGADAETVAQFGVGECGMLGCIAGWAVVLSYKRIPMMTGQADYFDKARRLLGLSTNQASRLFAGVRPSAIYDDEDDSWGWPRRFQKRYYAAKTARGRASAAVARIEHFIKTKGAE